MRSSTSFPHRRVLITGAGSGLGRALALRFARAGWRVAIADVNLAGAEETLAQVRAAGADGFVQACDITSEAQWQALVQRVQQEWQGLDVLVNNAGVSSAGTVAATSIEDWQWMLNINLLGVVRGCQAFLPMLQKQGAGHVVNIASFAAIASAPGMAAYNVAKAGVVSLSESLRAEVADRGVGVTVACPAFFQTNLLNSFRAPDPRVKATVERVMQRATVKADDVADDLYRAVMVGRFMVITHKDSRWQWRFKRLAPEAFFRAVRKSTRRFVDPAAKSCNS